MTSVHGEPSGLRGCQTPRLSLVPEYVSSTGDEAIELAAMAGLILDPWQQFVLRHSLGERADHKWAAFQVGLVVARQNGKNSVLEARELAEVFLISKLAGPRLVLHSAHRFDTSVEHFLRLENRIKDTPELLAQVKHRGRTPVGFRHAHGDEAIELADGSRIIFAARTRGGRRGYTADLLVFDESMEFPEEAMSAVAYTVSAKTGPQFVPGPQMWFTGSAVDQQKDPHGLVLAQVRERGLRGEDRSLAYFEWSAEDDAHPDDPEAWALANPGMGIRITAEHIALERESLPGRGFRVERLGIGDWPDTSEEAGQVIARDIWTALADPASKIAEGHMFALDIDPGQAWATLACAGSRDDGLWHIGVVEHRPGTAWIVDKAKQWLNMVSGARLVVDPRADLGVLLTELEDAGIQPIRVNASDYKDACGEFFSATVQKRLRYPAPQPELDSAVSVARTKPLLDAWKWDRASGGCITPLVACTLALWGARTQGAPEVWNLAEIAAELEPSADSGTPVIPENRPERGNRFIPLDAVPPRRGLFG